MTAVTKVTYEQWVQDLKDFHTFVKVCRRADAPDTSLPPHPSMDEIVRRRSAVLQARAIAYRDRLDKVISRDRRLAEIAAITEAQYEYGFQMFRAGKSASAISAATGMTYHQTQACVIMEGSRQSWINRLQVTDPIRKQETDNGLSYP